MKDPDLAARGITPYIFDAKIQQHTAVLAPGKRHIYIVKIIEDNPQPLHRGLIYIQRPNHPGRHYISSCHNSSTPAQS